MAINDRDFYASHGISYDIEEMQIEYTKRVIKQAKIEVLTELKSEIEKEAFDMIDLGYISNTDNANIILMDDLNKIIQHKINSLGEEK